MNGKIGYGNCFLNGLYLWYKLGFKGKLKIKTRPGTNIPHLIIEQEKTIWHFKVKKDLLPKPFHIFFFKGVYKKVLTQSYYDS